MSKEEFMKIQTCVLKVNLHCDGCKHKVKKILQKIDGVYKTSIDSEQGKVTISGNVDPAVLIKKLAKSGKHAELWGAPKANNNNQNHLAKQFKNLQLDNGKGGNNSNNNKGGQNGNNNNQTKGGQPTPQQLQQLQQLQLQQLQQMKGLQDLKLPQLKDMKMPPFNPNNNQKAVKFAEEEDFSDDYDDMDDDYDLDDDEYDDELDDPHHPLNKMKPMMGNGPKGVPNMVMLNGLMNGNHPQLMNAQNGGANGGGNGKKGGNAGGAGGNAVPVQVLTGGGNNEGKNGNGGKKGGGGGNQNQGGGGKNGAKNSGGLPQQVKTGNNCVGGANKNGGGANGGKKGNNGAPNVINDGFPSMGGPNGSMGHQMANMNMAMGQMGSLPMSQMSQMGNIPAVQGLPAAAMNNGGGGGGGSGGYFQGAGPDVMPGNPYHQQYLAALMNQQRAMGGNERFQPMMYARPPPAVNYMPPYPYPYPPPQPDPYTSFFSDENTSSCNVM
ncbi:hypothetical protein CRYUN_Cryun21dG0091900 [Craigia yunnanensis]